MQPVLQRRILVVDDEEPVRVLLKDCLELDGYRVTEAANAATALARLDEGGVDLVTLDLNLGGENGLELAQRIRSVCNVPIVMITGRGDTIDRVVGLELGADDYIAKPFHVREVLARVRAVLRRYERTEDAAAAAPVEAGQSREIYAFESWTLDVERRRLSGDDGQDRELTSAEHDMLVMFLRRPARVLSRDNIMDLLKGNEWSPLDRSIDALIARLRRKIEPCQEAPRMIKTVRGVGYVFAAPVRRV